MATRRKVIVIGAGMGGLVAALLSAAHGFDTLVLERAAAPGGKLRELEVEGATSTPVRPSSRCATCSRRCLRKPATSLAII